MKFKKSYIKIQALINPGSEINVMTLVYAAELGLFVRLTNVGAKKIDRSRLLTYGIVFANF